MVKEVKKDFLEQLGMTDMVATQVNAWEYTLIAKGLKEGTIKRKIDNVGMFYMHLMKERRALGRSIKLNEIGKLAFEHVRDGYFSEDNVENLGTKDYRVQIYSNIREGMNYIYERMCDNKNEIVSALNDSQKEMLEEIGCNKFFKCNTSRKEENCYDGIQVNLINELGIKVYFDKDNKPYVYSHELASVIGKPSNKVGRDIRTLLDRIGVSKIGRSLKNVDFTVLQATYVNEQNKKQPTYILHKDILITYVLGLNGSESMEFKLKYIDAFNYIEEEHTRLLKDMAEFKESFYRMFNDIRLKNRDLSIAAHNAQAKKKRKIS